jgi:NADPH:quinone reductase-like Zn-dependent oxidoreductase
MRAVRFHDYRGLSGIQYEDAPLPVLGDCEVLVRVHAAGVNPFDWYAVEGYVNQYVSFRLPAVLGRDVSGVVEAVGVRVDTLAMQFTAKQIPNLMAPSPTSLQSSRFAWQRSLST